MAYITQRDENEENQPGASMLSSGTGAFAGGGAGQAGASAPQGSGGSRRFVNIQQYLNANPGGSQSDRMINEKIGGQIAQEESAADKGFTDFSNSQNTAFNDYKTRADKALSYEPDWQANRVTVTPPGSKPAIGGIGQNKLDGLSGRAQFDKIASDGQFKQQVNTPWAETAAESLASAQNKRFAPQINSFSAAPSETLKGYGDAVSDQGKFKNLLNTIYGQQQGITPGQTALQRQMDYSNPRLEQARTQLSDKYKTFADKTAKQTADASALQSNLAGQAGEYQNKVNSLYDSVLPYYKRLSMLK